MWHKNINPPAVCVLFSSLHFLALLTNEEQWNTGGLNPRSTQGSWPLARPELGTYTDWILKTFFSHKLKFFTSILLAMVVKQKANCISWQVITPNHCNAFKSKKREKHSCYVWNIINTPLFLTYFFFFNCN